MGAGVSAEQFDAHLSRQQALLQRLDAAVQRSADQLQSAGSLVIDYSVDGDGFPEAENEDARQLLANAFYKRARDLNGLPPAEGPLDDDEVAGLMQPPDAVAEYDKDALVYKPWLAAMRKGQLSDAADFNGTAPMFPSGNSGSDGGPAPQRVFGFAGSMLRCAKWLDNHTAVYAVAGLVVVHDTQRNTQRFYRGHGAAITTVAVHPRRRLVASAELGFLPMIHVWNADTLQLVCTVADSWRSGIVALRFSPDGGEFAAVDYSDDHFLGVYNWEARHLVARTTHNYDVFDICFVPPAAEGDAPSLVSVGDRRITFWARDPTGSDDLIPAPAQLGNAGKKQAFTAVTAATRSSGGAGAAAASAAVVVVVGTQAGELYVFARQRLVRVLDAQTRLVACLSAVPGTSVVCCAGFDGHVTTWNLSSYRKMANFYLTNGSQAAVGAQQQQQHAGAEDGAATSTAPIQSLDVSPDGATALVGNASNVLTAVDIAATTSGSVRGPGRVLQGGGHGGDSISTLCCHPTRPRVATGGADLRVVEWDASAITGDSSGAKTATATATAAAPRSANPLVVRVHHIPAHATSIEYAPDGAQLAVGLSNGAVCIFRGDELAHSFSLGRRRVQCVRFSSNGRLLAAGTADNVIEVFDVSAGFAHVAQLTGGMTGVVINIDFAANDTVLRACTQSYELVYFDAGKKERVGPDAAAGLLWNTHSCLFGWDVQGIWRRDSEFNDVNVVVRSRSRRLLATAETTGLVKLFRYPCIGGGLDAQGVLQRRPDSVRLRGHVFNTLGADWLPADAGLATASPDCLILWKF